MSPEFAAFAENCGEHGVFVDDPNDLDEALETAIDHDGPTLVGIFTDSDPI